MQAGNDLKMRRCVQEHSKIRYSNSGFFEFVHFPSGSYFEQLKLGQSQTDLMFLRAQLELVVFCLEYLNLFSPQFDVATYP